MLTVEQIRKDPTVLQKTILKGFQHSAQGCDERATLGQRPKMSLNPEGVESWVGRLNLKPCLNPFRVVVIVDSLPRVARSSQPWAECQNPFGVKKQTHFK